MDKLFWIILILPTFLLTIAFGMGLEQLIREMTWWQNLICWSLLVGGGVYMFAPFCK